MKKHFLLMFAVMIGMAAFAQESNPTKMPNPAPAPAPKAADVLWLKETTHDFGKIPQGKPVTTEFELKNTGTDSLKLENVQAGCGCTTPIWKPGTYAPGQTFKITVGYNAAVENTFNKPVTITYSGGQQKVIYITGTVYATPSTPAPQNSNLGKIQK